MWFTKQLKRSGIIAGCSGAQTPSWSVLKHKYWSCTVPVPALITVADLWLLFARGISEELHPCLFLCFCTTRREIPAEIMPRSSPCRWDEKNNKSKCQHIVAQSRAVAPWRRNVFKPRIKMYDRSRNNPITTPFIKKFQALEWKLNR